MLKEFPTIILIYNRKKCRLDLLWFCMSMGIILEAIWPCTMNFGVQMCLLKYKPIQIGQPGQLIQFISVYLVIIVVLQYNHIWCNSPQREFISPVSYF